VKPLGLESPHWPLEVARLQAALRDCQPGSTRDELRGELWRLLFEALSRQLRLQSRTARYVQAADVEDIASEKALEILARAESGAWDSSGRSPAEISGYISSAARYGWIDYVQRASREVRVQEDDGEVHEYPTGNSSPAGAAVAPADRAESLELASAVRDCASALPERDRRIWFYRAFYDMSSREIAQHPLVRLRAAHVDVLVQRARVALRDCLRAKGHDDGEAPAGAFVELWAALESMAEHEGGGRVSAADTERRTGS